MAVNIQRGRHALMLAIEQYQSLPNAQALLLRSPQRLRIPEGVIYCPSSNNIASHARDDLNDNRWNFKSFLGSEVLGHRRQEWTCHEFTPESHLLPPATAVIINGDQDDLES
jgi:hypothetical protein